MRTGFPFLSRFLSKVVEIVGAGLASTAGAFLLGHIATPPAATPVVQIVPADAETIRLVHSDPIAEEVRKDLSQASAPGVEAARATASVKIDKAAKVKAQPAHRDHKADVARMSGANVAAAPLQIAPASERAEQQPTRERPLVGATDNSSGPLVAAQANESHFRLLAALRQIPEWLLPSTHSQGPVADIPRPPLPISQFWQSTM